MLLVAGLMVATLGCGPSAAQLRAKEARLERREARAAAARKSRAAARKSRAAARIRAAEREVDKRQRELEERRARARAVQGATGGRALPIYTNVLVTGKATKSPKSGEPHSLLHPRNGRRFGTCRCNIGMDHAVFR